MEREEPKVKLETVIKVCTEGIEMLSQGKVQETIDGLMNTLDLARQMMAVHNGREDVWVKARIKLGEVEPGTRGKLIRNDETGLLVAWEVPTSPRPLVDLFLRHNFEDYVDLESKCSSHHN